jgi:hypothetical protein
MVYAARILRHRSNLPMCLLLGFLFWLAILLVLQPGNVARAMMAGYALSFEREATRIIGAGVIGAASTPIVLWLVRRYAATGIPRLRDVALLVLWLIALAAALNVLSSFAAAWIFDQRWLPDASAVGDQLIRNWTLVAFALISLTALVKVANSVGLLRASSSSPIASHEPHTISVKVGRRTLRVEVDSIDWLEAQGNYVALHVGRDTHLVRETLGHFETLLDNSRFVRAHRRIIVAVARIRSIRSTDNGGAILTLDTGQQLVASRRHRRDVRKKWATLSGSLRDSQVAGEGIDYVP